MGWRKLGNGLEGKSQKENDKETSHVMRKPVYAIRSLISAFVIRCLDSIMPLVSLSEIASLYQAGLSLHWSQTLKPGFLVSRLINNR